MCFFFLLVVVVVVVSNFKSPSLMENNHWLHCQSGLEWGRTRQISDWALPSNINASFEIALKIHTSPSCSIPTAVARNCCNCLFVLFCFVFLILLLFPFWLYNSPPQISFEIAVSHQPLPSDWSVRHASQPSSVMYSIYVRIIYKQVCILPATEL